MFKDVRIIKKNEGSVVSTGKLLAIANVTLELKEGTFAINGFKVVQGKEAPFVNMPQGAPYEKNGKKEYPDVFFPVTKESREVLVKTILDAYNASLTAE
jgi:DNA-binding cell septation regulator SpoVG